MSPQLLRLLRRFLRPAWALPAMLCLSILTFLAEGVGIGITIPFIQSVLGEQGAEEPGPFLAFVNRVAGHYPEEGRMPLLAATLLGLVMFKGLVSYGSGALTAWVRYNTVHALRRAIYDQFLHVGYDYLSRRDPGRLFQILHGQTGQTSETIYQISGVIFHACAFLVFTAVLLAISWQFTLAVGVGVLAISQLARRIAKRSRRLGGAGVAASERLAEVSTDGIHSMRTIRVFGAEEREGRRFDAASQDLRDIEVRTDLWVGSVAPLTEFLYMPIFLGAAALAWHLELGHATLLACLLLFYRAQPHVRALEGARAALASSMVTVENVARVLDRSDKSYARSGSRRFDGLTGAVAFRGVGFDYEPGSDAPPALDAVSLELRAGRVTAIVGGSGAGKSTLVNLLLRLYEPGSGEILVDGVPLHEIDLRAWRRGLALAGQDAELLGGSVADNIAYARPDAKRSEIVAVAKSAAAHEFIEALPEGYETPVGARGLRLSGGQRQRIGLARALLRRPSILILDEATNALDNLSESLLQENLERLRGDVTVVVIAHRLGTIRNADHVVVMGEGRVVEQGAPDELFARNGLFTRLYELEAQRAGDLGPSAPGAA